MLNGKSILITGGTGSFGKKFVETVFRDYPGIKKLLFIREENQLNMLCRGNILINSILNCAFL